MFVTYVTTFLSKYFKNQIQSIYDQKPECSEGTEVMIKSQHGAGVALFQSQQ